MIGGVSCTGEVPGSGPDAIALTYESDLASIATPYPGEKPDFTRPFWYQKWLIQDEARARYDISINGIEVGPTVARRGIPCDEGTTPDQVPLKELEGSAVDITMHYFPEGAKITSSGGVKCHGNAVSSEIIVQLPALSDSELAKRLAEGESYFDLPHGASFSVFRIVADPAFESGIAAERWQSGIIAGFPAAIAGPLIEGGFGDAAVIIHHEGILTVIRSTDLAFDDLIAVAEGIMR